MQIYSSAFSGGYWCSCSLFQVSGYAMPIAITVCDYREAQ